MRVLRLGFVLMVAMLAGGAVAAFWPPPGERTLRQFDPARMASFETDMWKAYYGKQRVRLFVLLVRQLHEQSRFRWVDATRVGFHFARAAGRFSESRGDYEQVVPDLVAGYDITRRWVGGAFDPMAVARAELAWWVARRIPGQNAPAQVGRLMALAYAQLYEAPFAAVSEAARLRAEAAALRDAGGARADWNRVESLLRQSYRALHEALNAPRLASTGPALLAGAAAR